MTTTKFTQLPSGSDFRSLFERRSPMVQLPRLDIEGLQIKESVSSHQGGGCVVVVVGDDVVFVYTGGEQQVPRDVKRVRIAENVDTILQRGHSIIAHS